jgi:hypothetical protein
MADVNRHKYTRAREMQGHAQADTAVAAAVNAPDAQLGRLAYDALRWHASKLVPKVYGDKTEVAVTGADRGSVHQLVHVPVFRARVLVREYRTDRAGTRPATFEEDPTRRKDIVARFAPVAR